MTRLLVIMGSGETSPTMVKVHRAPVRPARAGAGAGRAARHAVRVPGERRRHRRQGGRVLPRRASGARSRWPSCRRPTAPTRSAYETDARRGCGPPGTCSPAPAARPTPCAQWAGSQVPAVLAEKLRDRRVRHLRQRRRPHPRALHRAGVRDLQGRRRPALARRASTCWPRPACGRSVIPHFDNAEGGNHDTRFCYLGERRLAVLEAAAARRRVRARRRRAHRAASSTSTPARPPSSGSGVVTVRRGGRRRRPSPPATTVPHRRAAGGGRGRRRRGGDGSRSPAGRPSTPAGAAGDPLLDGSRRARGDVRRRAGRAGDAPAAVQRRPRARATARRLVARHAAVRRARPGPGGPAVDGRAPGRGGRGRRRAIPATSSARSSRRCSTRARPGPGRPAAWPTPTPSATGWSPPASRCATRRRAPTWVASLLS